MTLATLLAIAVSATLLLLIGLRDPKRLRAAGERAAQPHTTKQRRVLATLVLVPGVLLALAAQSAGFIIWLGATVAIGWLLTQLLAVAGRAPRDTHTA